MTIEGFDASNQLVVVTAVDQDLQKQRQFRVRDGGGKKLGVKKDGENARQTQFAGANSRIKIQQWAHTCVFFLTESARIERGPLHDCDAIECTGGNEQWNVKTSKRNRKEQRRCRR